MNDWKESLVRYFTEGIKEEASSCLGVEVEHFIIDKTNQRAVPYSGESGVRQILYRLMERYPNARVLPDDGFFGFSVPEFTITLEPAAQLEISITATDSIRRIGEIYRGFSQNLSEVLAPLGYTAFNAGCVPVGDITQTEQIPKRRYDLMNAHFKGFGTGGAEMMRGTASLQVSIDYSSQEDFRDKIHAAYYYAPIFKLLCDHSPVYQGQPVRTHLKRTDIWRRTDHARCGILPGIFSETYGFEDYARFLGDMPPIFLKRGQIITPTGSQTVAELFEGKALSENDITHIISMAFPDVRLKKYLEIRVADSVPYPFMLAYCALIKGLLYSEAGLSYAHEQVRVNQMTQDDVLRAEDDLMARGWSGNVYGLSAAELTEKLLQLARDNLSADEAALLEAFDAVIRWGGIQNIPRDAYVAVCRA